MREISPLAAARTALLLLATATPRLGDAQELSGTLRLPDGRTPAAGVVLLALQDSGPAIVGRTLSGDNGAFRLRVPAGALRLRALRVGFRPSELGRFTLEAGRTRVVELTLSNDPVVLQAITTRAADRCLLAAAAGAEVVSLFEEARIALHSTQLEPPEGRPRTRILLETRLLSPEGRERQPPLREVRDGVASRPFRSAPPAQLAAMGYVINEPDGTTYFAPDATVILSDQFVAAHCLRLVESKDGGRQVGIAFEPTARRRGTVGIKGTLWLDAERHELQRLDFSYVGLSPLLERANLGGSVEFTQLPGGLWFEDRWEIRMPRMVVENRGTVAGISSSATGTAERIDAIQRTAGRVISMRRGRDALYQAIGLDTVVSAALRSAADTVQLRTDSLRLRSACPAPRDRGADTAATVVGIVRGDDGRPVAGATVTATWREQSRQVGTGWRWRDRELRTQSSADGAFALCELPRLNTVRLEGRDAGAMAASLSVRLDDRAAVARSDLTLRPPR